MIMHSLLIEIWLVHLGTYYESCLNENHEIIALIADGHLTAILWLLMCISQPFSDCFGSSTTPIGHRKLYGAPRVHSNGALMAVMWKAPVANGHLTGIKWLLLGTSQPFNDCCGCNAPPTGNRNLHGALRVHNNRTLTAVMYKALIANGHLMAILWLLMGLSSRLMPVLAVILHLLATKIYKVLHGYILNRLCSF